MDFTKIVDTLAQVLLDQIDPAELKKWVDMEANEHHFDEEQAKQLVIDHIKENGLGYYPALIQMEAGLKANREANNGRIS